MATTNKTQRSGGGSPRPDRPNYTGEESGTSVSTNRCDDGQKPDCNIKENTGDTLKKGRKLRIGTWNVRSLYEGKHQIVQAEMERLGIDIMGISEHRWSGQGHFTSVSGTTTVYAGRERSGQSGVGFILTKETTKTMLGYNPVSDRIITIRLKRKARNITIIQVYAPTSSAEEEDLETFYDALQEVINKVHKQDIKLIMGDLNAKVGCERRPEENRTKGPFGLGQRNERGERWLSFCLENNLTIANTLFEQHPRRLYTWTSPDGKTKNQIDYITIQQRWKSSIMSCKTYPGADCDSDHNLLVANIKIRLKRVEKKAGPVRYDTRSIPTEYRVEIQNKFNTLMTIQEEMTPDELANSIRDSILSSAKAYIPKREKATREYITDSTLEMIKQRRKIKPQRNDEQREAYKRQSKEIRRKIRQDKKNYINSKCKDIEELQAQGKSKDMFKEAKALTTKFQPFTRTIEDKMGNTLTESKDILNRWMEYCREMYEDKNRENDINQINSEETEPEPEPIIEEVRWAIKNLKTGKSPGCDELVAELIQAGGESSAQIYHALCVKIWRSETWPKDWKRSIYIPLPKKGNLKLCSNHRTIALISHASKILLKIIMKRMETKMEEEINIVQAGFRKTRGTRDHILNMRNIIEKCREFNVDICTCFIDYSKAFDSVTHQKLWNIMHNMGFPHHLISLIKTLYQEQEAAVRIEGETSDWFMVQKGVRQGCILSPHLFNIYTENIMRNVREDPNYDHFQPLNIGGHEIPEVRYADDTALISRSPAGLEEMILSVKHHSEAQDLFLNAKKTKIMHINRNGLTPKITIDNEELENVSRFEYLGSTIDNTGDCSIEIRRRLTMALQKTMQMKNLWQGASRKTKIQLLRSYIFPVATYGCETWTMTSAVEKRITAFEMKCYRRVLRIPWTEKRTNVDIRKDLNIKENWLLTNIKRRKLSYFGHIKRHNGLERLILEGQVPGKRERGRPRRRWTQDIKDLLHMPLEEAGRLAQEREAYRVAVRTTFCKGHVT